MKFEKIDPKQVPQVIMLCVLGVGAFGFAGYSLLGATAPKTSAAAAPAATQTAGAEPVSSGSPAGQTTGEGQPAVGEAGQSVQGAKPEGPALHLPEVFNADPFRPAVKQAGVPGTAPQAAPAPKASVPVKTAEEAPRKVRKTAKAPRLPRAVETASESKPSAPAVVVPPAPERPEVAVTGIIDSEEGTDMALVELGTEHRIIQVGDLLPNNYKVKKISMTGVLLVNGKDRFFVALGNKADEKSKGA